MLPEPIVSSLLKEIDEELRQERVAIPFRPLHAMGRLAKRLDREVGGEFLERANNWFKARYGDRLLGAMLLGRLPFLLRGDIHLILLAPQVEKVNGLLCPGLAWSLDAGELPRDLTHEETLELDDLLEFGWHCFSELNFHVCERVLPVSATVDLDTSITELMRPHGPQTGLSKWASLQAAEKSLKEFIRLKGGSPPRTHDLKELNRLAVGHGLPDLEGQVLPDGPVLQLAQASPGVRYGDEAVSIKDAVGAFYAALSICMLAAVKLRLEAGGKIWSYPEVTSPGSFMVRRLFETQGLPHRIEE